jgi:DNA-binding MltR family transcriptional regulator
VKVDKTDSPIYSVSQGDWIYWSQQYQKETDRGLAITSSAMLDHLLASLIEAFLVNDKKATKELLKGPNSPLGTFWSRIIIAYSLGLIPSDERNDLELIGEIRNKFAHKAIHLSYETDPISNLINKFKIPKMQNAIMRINPNRTKKSIYIDTVSMISTFIEKRKLSITDRRIPAKKFILKPN